MHNNNNIPKMDTSHWMPTGDSFAVHCSRIDCSNVGVPMMTSICIPATPAEGRGSAPTFPVGVRVVRSAVAFLGNGEPPLAEVMDDEVVRRMMARDGVQPDQLLSLIDAVRNRLG